MKTIKITKENIQNVANKVRAFMVRNEVVSCQSEYRSSKNEIEVLGLKNNHPNTNPFLNMFFAEIYTKKESPFPFNVAVKKSNACFIDFLDDHSLKIIEMTIVISNKTSFILIGIGDKIQIGTTTISIKRSNNRTHHFENKGVKTTISKVHYFHYDFVRRKIQHDNQISEEFFNDLFSEDSSDFFDEFGNSDIQF